jgi:hypothetical protein
MILMHKSRARCRRPAAATAASLYHTPSHPSPRRTPSNPLLQQPPAMSLADELLGDLDDSGSDRSRSPSPPPVASTSSAGAGPSSAGLMLPPSLPTKRTALEASLDSLPGPSTFKVKKEDPDGDEEMEALLPTPAGGVRPTDELDRAEVERMQLGAVQDVRQVAKLLTSRRLEEILKVRPNLREGHSCRSNAVRPADRIALRCAPSSSSRRLPTSRPTLHQRT